ncbi:MAG: hypothetical protein IFNCLDLE_02701 [Ignavibacteriaceae bacterium]|nr:hypothetical protein [Ignavibacteriaceae bacterium]
MFDPQVTEVTVKVCCGSYCVWLKDFMDKEFRVARFNMDTEDAQENAVEFAKQLAQSLNAKYK